MPLLNNYSLKNIFLFRKKEKGVSFKNIFVLFLFLILFFPSINFGIINAEIFPWAIIVSLLIIKKYDASFLLMVFFILLNTTFTLIIFSETNLFPEAIRSSFAYINALIAFTLANYLAFKSCLKIAFLVKFLFSFLIIIGFLQAFNLISFLDPFLKFLIPRASSSSLSFSGRGVTLLSTEPARAGNELIFLYLIVRTVFLKNESKKWLDLFMLFYLLVIIKSAMALGFFLVILILFHGVRAIVPLFLGGLGLLSLNQDFSFGRAFDLIVTLLTDDSSFSDKIFLLVNTSGNRLVSIYSSFNFPFYHFFGGGIGNWKESSIEALSLINFDVSQLNYIIRFGEDSGMRSSGFVSNLVLDTGIPGLLFLILHLKRHLKKYWNISKESKTIIVIFLVKIFFIGSVGHPVAWLLVIVALKYLYVNRKETINQSITQSITNTI